MTVVAMGNAHAEQVTKEKTAINALLGTMGLLKMAKNAKVTQILYFQSIKNFVAENQHFQNKCYFDLNSVVIRTAGYLFYLKNVIANLME